MKKGFRSGYIGLVGRTNVGKSTLVNQLLRQKVVTTSNKPQTTRNRINCILNLDGAQLVFTDTPGFFKPKNLLIRNLNQRAEKVFDDADIIMVLVDIAGGLGEGDNFVIDKVKDIDKPKVLVLNKADLVPEEDIVDIRLKLEAEGQFDEVIAVSALKGDNTRNLLEILVGLLPQGPKYFPEDMLTDQPFKDTVSDIVREKLSVLLRDELPYSINVEVTSIDKNKTKKEEDIYDIRCDVFVEKDSQKAIVIGRKGSVLKKAGNQARIELERLTGVKVFLQLWVKVAQNWTKNEKELKNFGYT